MNGERNQLTKCTIITEYIVQHIWIISNNSTYFRCILQICAWNDAIRQTRRCSWAVTKCDNSRRQKKRGAGTPRFSCLPPFIISVAVSVVAHATLASG